VDIALPGVLPVANRGAVERAIRFGLAVGGEKVINRRSVFARKNYFYPDLPKGYQISQYELPSSKGEKSAFLRRAARNGSPDARHLEEDAASRCTRFPRRERDRSQPGGRAAAGNRLEPDMRSAEEAVAYAKALHALVRWIDICDGNMQEGSFRCDANVSCGGRMRRSAPVPRSRTSTHSGSRARDRIRGEAPDRDSGRRRKNRTGDEALRSGQG